MSFSQDYYCYPIFTSYRNDVPLTPELGIIEASHVRDLPLERRIHAMPDIEVFLMDDDHPPQWFLGIDLTHALHGAYTHALCVFGEAVQPAGWNRRKPWANYDYATELVKIGFPYIPRPICFKEDVYHFPANSFHKLQQQVHHNNFYAFASMLCQLLSLLLNRWSIVTWPMLGIFAAPHLRFGASFLVPFTWSPSSRTLQRQSVRRRVSIAGFPVNGYDGDNEALGPITPPPENVPPPQLVDFAEVPFDYAAWGLPPRESSEQPETAYLGYQNGDSFTAPEYAPLHAANEAGEFPAPEYAHSHEFDIAALTQQLSLVAVAQSVESVSPGFGNDFVASVWEWPGEPNPVVDLGPPEWPTVPQQHTPPFSWEDHWHEVHARDLELSNNQGVDIGGGLEIDSEHIIRPLSVVTS
ncbi:hypothetical protein RhiXN_12235 [Rhizoctonia solani]|uniref:Uncharacterized protein n=1 Tax=Rhizoctonia solani TaxID=456999 RepID=A0A8H8T2Q1_9AGAM|nr:uncharacterized protein RhiXN_12235 [Rhizoctonia solani]QRW26574.1 hypothetical protein RhiXN_12235 [Rhizoctonia solani]